MRGGGRSRLKRLGRGGGGGRRGRAWRGCGRGGHAGRGGRAVAGAARLPPRLPPRMHQRVAARPRDAGRTPAPPPPACRPPAPPPPALPHAPTAAAHASRPPRPSSSGLAAEKRMRGGGWAVPLSRLLELTLGVARCQAATTSPDCPLCKRPLSLVPLDQPLDCPETHSS